MGHASSNLADVRKLSVAAASPLGVANVSKKKKESKVGSSESNTNVKFEGIKSPQSEHSAK
jgi:hypothetical protein